MDSYRRKNSIRNGVRLDGQQYYFITLRTKDRNPVLAGLDNGKIHLSNYGEIANSHWKKIPEIYPFTRLYEYVIMPEHIHGIIQITEKGPHVKSISHIMQYYKQTVTKQVHLSDPWSQTVFWQRSFWARGFWKLDELEAYEKYIRENPVKASKKK